MNRLTWLCVAAMTIAISACGPSANTGPQVGTISGVIADTVFGAIAAASVAVTPTGQPALPAVVTDGQGKYSVAGVPPGGGTVTVSALPTGCATPSAAPFSGLTAGGSVTVDFTVSCPTAVGSVFGTVTNAYGILEAGALVLVTPSGGAPLPAVTTDANGSYTVRSVPVGHGSVTVSHLLKGCQIPAPVAYRGVGPSDSIRADVAVPCPESTPLFLSTEVGGLYPFSAALLATSGSTLPSPIGVPSSYGPVTAMTFDASGNLWTATEGHYASDGVTTLPGGIVGYAASQLSGGSNASPALVVTFPAAGFMQQISGMAFDNQGTLWVAGHDESPTGGLYGYAAGQLTANGSPTPAHILQYPIATGGLAFDAAGNLWVEEIAGPIVEFTPSQLVSASGSPTPTNVVNGIFEGNPQVPVRGLAFDASGNLWVASTFDSVVAVSAASLSQLGTNNAPSPMVQLQTSTPPTFASQLAFDLDGNLWVLNISDGTSTVYGTPPTAILRFPAASLGSSGGAPDITINLAAIPSSASGSSAMAFAPGAGLPLNGSAIRRQRSFARSHHTR